MSKKNPALIPAAILITIVILAGVSLIKLNVQRRLAEQHAAARQLAETSAYSIEQEIEHEFATVENLTGELRSRGSVENFAALAAAGAPDSDEHKLFLISGGKVTFRFAYPDRTAVLTDLLATGWNVDPNIVAALPQSPELLNPVRIATGEWIVIIREPLVFGTASGTRHFAGWVAAAVPLDNLLRSAGLDKLAGAGFNWQLSYFTADNSQPHKVSGSADSDLEAPIKQVIHATHDRWFLAVAPANGWLPWRLLVSNGMLVAILALFTGVLAHDLAQRPEQLRIAVMGRDQRLRVVNQRLSDEIQQREDLEKQFSHASFHDALTGLPNRRYFIDRLRRAQQRARQNPGYLLAVIVLNFDRFKNINDSLGPAAGDELLTQAVRRFETCLRPEDLVIARLAGDEFAMLLFDIGSTQVALSAAERLQNTLAEPFKIGERNVFTTASMGIACVTSGYEDAEELVRGAHIALSKAKADGRAQRVVFDPATREQIVTRQQLETDLHQAIERQEFFLNYQPIISLETGIITGMEALIRWRHPLEGAVPPDRFISLAEETGLIVPITRWVLRQACTQARIWREQFPSEVDFYISVNLSAQDFRQADVCDYISAVIAEHGLPPGMLRLEVTESIMIGNINVASELISRLRAMEIPLLLDDFGTGYSSLSYLNRFKFDYIKIDRAFVSRITSASQNVGIVRAIVHLAQDLGIRTIAEGVETLENKDNLRSLGCDFGQGYYFSKPVAAELVEKLLLARTRW